ncbi:MAG TPA: ATP-binding protein [Anaerolineaceae bacterium]
MPDTTSPEALIHAQEAAEQLNDLLVNNNPLEDTLREMLKTISSVLGNASVVLLVPSQDETQPYLYLEQNLPPAWKAASVAPESQFHEAFQLLKVKRQPFTFFLEDPDQIKHPACIFPILYNDNIEGALVTLDGLSERIELTTRILLRPVGRAITLSRKVDQTHTPGIDLTALYLIASAQNTMFDINRTQEILLSGLRELFGGDAVLLIQIDQINPNLIFKKTLGDADKWLLQQSMKLEKSAIEHVITTGHTLVITDISSSSIYNAAIDGLPLMETHSLLCAPLSAKGQKIGAIEIINFKNKPITDSEQNILSFIATSLANSMASMQLIEQLKIANADLEASRWELLHSRNILRALFDSIPSSIYIVDNNYTLAAINRSRANRTNQPINQLVGKKCYTALFHRLDPCPSCRVNETLTNGQSTTRAEREWGSENDQPTEWEITTYAINDPLGTPIQAILLEQDVTEKRRLEANLVQSEKLAAVGQLAAGVAHEINNPLAAVIANAQLIQRGQGVDEDTLESARLIETAGIRASQVVRNLLGFARREKYDFSPTDLNETIRNAVSLVQHELVAHGVNLILALQDNLPKVIASRDHLQGVWVNLLVNAIDAIDHSDGEIRVISRFATNEYRVIVADNGKGISPENLSRIFEPFYTTKAPNRGTGLGLSLCHRVIKSHGGHIQVDSNPGKGTKFVVSLPGPKD